MGSKLTTEQTDRIKIAAQKSQQIYESSKYADLSDTNNAVFLTFRGTADPVDVIHDLNVDVYSGYHKGFLRHLISSIVELIEEDDSEDYDDIVDRCKALVKEVYERIKSHYGVGSHEKKRLIISGHSLGGACALLFSHFLKPMLDIEGISIEVFTFGAPFVSVRELGLIEAINIVNKNDPVPRMLGRAMGDKLQEILPSELVVWLELDDVDDYICNGTFITFDENKKLIPVKDKDSFFKEITIDIEDIKSGDFIKYHSIDTYCELLGIINETPESSTDTSS